MKLSSKISHTYVIRSVISINSISIYPFSTSCLSFCSIFLFLFPSLLCFLISNYFCFFSWLSPFSTSCSFFSLSFRLLYFPHFFKSVSSIHLLPPLINSQFIIILSSPLEILLQFKSCFPPLSSIAPPVFFFQFFTASLSKISACWHPSISPFTSVQCHPPPFISFTTNSLATLTPPSVLLGRFIIRAQIYTISMLCGYSGVFLHLCCRVHVVELDDRPPGMFECVEGG